MKYVTLENETSIFNQFIAELRDVEIQKDSMRFRRNLERIGEVMAYRISQTLEHSKKTVVTPLGTKEMDLVHQDLVITSILRAALPLHNGLLNFFDRAQSGFIAAYRKYEDNHIDFEVDIEYISSPSIEGKTLIISDPILATGLSLAKAYKELIKRGQPKVTHIVTAISAPEGIKNLEEALKGENVVVWTGAMDSHLDDHSYIVPGLGDAGDLSYGTKL